MDLSDDDAVAFNGAVIVVNSDGVVIAVGVHIVIEDEFLSDGAFDVEGDAELIC